MTTIRCTKRIFYFSFNRDEDMQSMASLMSVNNSDIAPLDDFDNEDIPEDVEEIGGKSLEEVLDISTQIDFLTNSLTESEIASTPISGTIFVPAAPFILSSNSH